MKKIALITLLSSFVLLSSQHSLAQGDNSKPKVVTAAQVNGTWKYRDNVFKIWALGKNELHVSFSGVYKHQTAQGPSANTGDGDGIAIIDGDTAKFKPRGAEDECMITMKFTGGKLEVNQVGICGFGFNVTAEGTYNKTSSRKPKFDS
ncbi:MAG TPA: hypothetical protein VFC63_22390 [Blastocatellia bacterium]|nr:hypothetical protein [Blastocatellia bacterium]